MKYLGKILCMLLPVMLCLSQPAWGAQCGTARQTEAVETLTGLGILPAGGEADLSGVMSRAEFVTLMVGILAPGVLPAVSSQQFDDVPLTHPAAGAIDCMVKQGIVSGNTDGTFAPDQPIWAEQAVKILVGCIGYGVVAQASGGYPAGYYVAAQQAGILSDVPSGSGAITRGDAYVLVYNALHADMLVETGFGETITLEAYKDRTLLSERLHIYQAEGVVTDNGRTGLTGDSAIGRDQVRVGDAVYDAGETSAVQLLGQAVTCYYREEGGGRTLCYIRPSRRNMVTTVSAADIRAEDAQLSLTCLPHGNDGNEQAAISEEADFIYNGKAYPDFQAEEFALGAGYVTLVDNNGDGTADVVLVTEFENFVVKSVSQAEQTVYDQCGKTLRLDFAKQDITMTRQDGSPLTLAQVREWMVLSVARSKDGECTHIIGSTSKVTGVIREWMADTPARLVINDNIYRLSREYDAYVQNNAFVKNTLKVGVSAVLYRDITGEVAFADVGTGEGVQYGFLLEAVCRQGLDSDKAMFRIFTGRGEVIEPVSADRVVVKGSDERKYTGAEVLALPVARDAAGDVRQQVVKYGLNSEGELYSIAFAEETAGDYELYEFYTAGTESGIPYRRAASSFGEYSIGTDTLVFFSERPAEATRLTADDLYIADSSRYTDGRPYTITAFDFGYAKTPKAVYVELSNTNYRYQYDAFIVDRVSEAVDAQGELRQKLTGLSQGKQAEYLAQSEDVLAGLRQGDMILISVNNQGRVAGVRKVFDVAQHAGVDAEEIIFGSNFHGELVAVSGMVYAKEDNALGVRSLSGIRGHAISGTTNYYLYDSSAPDGKKVSVSNANEIVPAFPRKEGGSRVFILRRYDLAKDVYIIQ